MGNVIPNHALKEVLRLRMSKRKSMSISTLPVECPAFCRLCQSGAGGRREVNRPGAIRQSTTTGQASTAVDFLEAPAIRMDAKEVAAEPYRMLATGGVFYLAIGEGERASPKLSPTYFRIWKTPLITDRFNDHDFPAFSNLRRSGWRQMTPEPRRVVYSQPSGFSIRQYEISRDCPRYLVRHRSRCGTGLWILTVSSVMASLPSRD